MIKALIVTHGRLGKELLTTAELITGKNEGVRILSNENMSVSLLTGKITEILRDKQSADNLIIFTDMKCGSCYLAGLKAVREFIGIRIITGINLQMILSFITNREKYIYSDLCEKIKKDGLKAISNDEKKS